MWTVQFPGDKDHPEASWGWNVEHDRPHFFDVMTRRVSDRKGLVTQYPILLIRSDEGKTIELGRVLKHSPTNWWCFGFYRNHLRQPTMDDLVVKKLPLETRIAAWEAFQADFYERGAGFRTQRAAVTHMLYRTSWYSAPL